MSKTKDWVIDDMNNRVDTEAKQLMFGVDKGDRFQTESGNIVTYDSYMKDVLDYNYICKYNDGTLNCYTRNGKALINNDNIISKI